ncbi:MAG: sigma-70 family RNA polymerase sigma factor [Ruminococcaceae bacterium]|nr:sigma-70 family RNA polymerase sigma factor [Oscillospiraceae bacterium]
MDNRHLKSLILSFRKQDMCAFSEIYENFKKLINHYALKLNTEDALPELTLFLIELLYDIELDRFAEYSSDSIARYISVSLRNKYISISRENQKYRSFCSELYENEVFYKDNLFENFFVADALCRLSHKQKLVIVYKYIYNYSDTELAFMLGTTRQSINRIKNRALSTLKNFYEK